MSAIEIQNLHKKYGSHVAVNGLSFSVSSGEVVGFLGPNGAGKSTTMKILCGFISPTSGNVKINGIDVLEYPISAQKQIGYLPENAPIYPDMRVEEYLHYIGKIRNLGRHERQHAIRKTAEQCDITPRLNQLIGHLSKGYRQRVGLAQALLHDPDILILDEPTTGLDPNQIQDIRNLIFRIGRQKTIILSTHILSEVKATCNRAIIINRGTPVADGPVDEIISHSQGGTTLHVTLANGKVAMSTEELQKRLKNIQGITKITSLSAQPEQHRFSLLANHDLREEIFHFSVQEGLVLLEMYPSQNDLEDVFRRLTRDSSTPA